MVKQFSDTLIRLHNSGTSDSKPGLVFDNNFNTDIEVNPGAQIALSSLSMPYANQNLVISGNNDTLAFKVTGSAGGSFQTCAFPHEADGINKGNFAKFFRDTSDRMNAFLRTVNSVTGGSNTKQTGMRIVVRQNEQSKTSFQFRHGGTTNFNGTTSGDIQKLPGGNEFTTRPRRTAGESENSIKKLITGGGPGPSQTSLDIGSVDGSQPGYIAHVQPICTGCGFFHGQIYNFIFDEAAAGRATPDICGLLIGLTDNVEKINLNTLTDADLTHAIRIQQPKRTAAHSGPLGVGAVDDPNASRNRFHIKTQKSGNFSENGGGHGITDNEIANIVKNTANPSGGTQMLSHTLGIRDNPYFGFVIEGDATNSKTVIKYIYYQKRAGTAGDGQFDRIVLHEQDLPLRDTQNKDKLYYPVIAVVGSDNAISNIGAQPSTGVGGYLPGLAGSGLKAWGRVQYNPDPYHKVIPSDAETKDREDNQLTLPIPSASAIPTNYELVMNESVSNFLGFTQSTLIQGPVIEAFFEGFNSFKPGHNADMYIVEPLNIPLKTYDGLELLDDDAGSLQQFGRRNVLYYVPEAETILNEDSAIVQYDAREKIFLDIQNQQKLVLRNIKIRVTDEFYQPIGTVGPSELVLVIRNFPGAKPELGM